MLRKTVILFIFNLTIKIFFTFNTFHNKLTTQYKQNCKLLKRHHQHHVSIWYWLLRSICCINLAASSLLMLPFSMQTFSKASLTAWGIFFELPATNIDDFFVFNASQTILAFSNILCWTYLKLQTFLFKFAFIQFEQHTFYVLDLLKMHKLNLIYSLLLVLTVLLCNKNLYRCLYNRRRVLNCWMLLCFRWRVRECSCEMGPSQYRDLPL